MFLKKSLLLTVFVLAFFVSAFGQKYNIKTYSVNDGLPSSYVNDVLIDDQGFVWYATANGLVKFDGLNFKNYDTNNGLKDALIYDLHKDKNGDLWVSTEFGGVAKFSIDTETAVYLEELSELDSIQINYINEGPDETLWFATDKHGIVEWDKEKGVSFKLNEENGLPYNQVWDFVFDEDRKIWISTSSGVAVYDEKKGIIDVFRKQNGLAGELTYHVYPAADGKKWVSTSNGVSIINTDYSIENITEIDGRRLNYVFSITEDKNGIIWIGTEGDGLYWFDGEIFTHITKRNGLSSNEVFRLIKDSEGVIWVATTGDGVNIFKDKEFKIFDGASDLDVNTIYSSLKASDGTLWFGTEDGISSFNKGKFKNYTLPESLFSQDEIWDIEEMSSGNLLMLTYDHDIIEFDGSSFYHPSFYDILYPYYISDILTEEDGTIWFTAFQALLKYKDGKLEKIDLPTKNYWQTELNFITKDSRGYYWIGTEAGVARFDGDKFKFIAEDDGLIGGSIYDIKEDENGALWVGTNKAINVLYNFDDQDFPQNIIQFETEEFHLQETIFLQFDQFGNLWQGTNGGLNYFDLDLWRGHRIVQQQHFPLNDFGYGIEFNGFASLLDNDGTLWFGSDSKGLITYTFPEGASKITPANPPKVYLREILANNTSIFNPSVNDAPDFPIRSDFDQNNINFRFNAIDYTDPNRINYQYKLEGFEEDWHLESSISEARYTNLPPGAYKFLVRTKSVKSGWSRPVQLASISVDIPFWKTTQFILTAFISSLLLIGIFVRSYVDRKEKRNLKALVDEQTKELKSALVEKEVLIKEIHHRVKNNLAVVSGLLELQSWDVPEGDAKSAIQESKLRILAMSKIHENLYQNDDLARVNFKKFLEDLVSSVSATMKKQGFEIELKLNIDELAMDVNTGIPVGLIVNEVVSNCYKHAFNNTKSGIINVSFTQQSDSYTLEICDNGVGSEENLLDKKTSSLGITLVKSLSSQINGTLSYHGDNGSKFSIVFPKIVTNS